VRKVVVSVLIDLAADHPYHRATMKALQHASDHLDLAADIRVVNTDEAGDVDSIARPGTAIVIGPGSPYRSQDAAHAVVRAARERGVPLVGT